MREHDAVGPVPDAPGIGVELLNGEDPDSRSLRDADHWFDVYTDLLRTEQWLLDDGLPNTNILKVRLRRLRDLGQRRQFWRERQAELRMVQRS